MCTMKYKHEVTMSTCIYTHSRMVGLRSEGNLVSL